MENTVYSLNILASLIRETERVSVDNTLDNLMTLVNSALVYQLSQCQMCTI